MFGRLIKGIIKAEGAKGVINLVFVDDYEIRRLNKAFRKINRATDVLSFPMGEGGCLGDIAISAPAARRNAGRYGVKYKAELKRLVIHGALHLLGYDHGLIMRQKEGIYAKKVF